MVSHESTATTAIGTSNNAAIKRDELYLNLTVPNLFRCPISMDVMKSPVSLCTGVTYDRTSIQTWLSQGHNTCPATMQILPSTDFTPNLTLRRLIHLYLHHTSSSPAELSPSSSSRNPLLSQSEVLELIKNLSSGDRASSATKLVDFVKFSGENRRFIANSAGVVSDLIEVLRNSEETQVSDQILLILEILAPENGVKELLNEKILKSDFDYLSKFFWFFRQGSLSSRIASAKILESMAFDADSQRKIAEKQGLLHELYKLSDGETDSNAVEASLSALISISTSKMAKKELVRFGIVKTAGKILSGSDSVRPDPIRPVIEKALMVLVLIATCTDGRVAISEDEACIMGVVKRLMKCSGVATEHGIMVLWSLCCLARDRTAQERVIKVNGLTKVLLVMQSDCSAGVRQMCGDLVKVLRVKNSKSCLASYETKTTHIMPY